MKKKNILIMLMFSFACQASYLKQELDSIGNQNVSYNDGHHKFFLYPEKKGNNEFNEYNLSESYMSANHKYGVIERRLKAVNEGLDGESSGSVKNKCDIVDLSSGCIIYTFESDCDVRWNGNALVSDIHKLSKEKQSEIFSGILLLPPDKMIKQLIYISENKNLYMGDSFFLNGETYTSCFPINKLTESKMNDVGYYLSQGGLNEEAISIYKVIQKFDPNRIVLMLNMADAFWALGQKQEASGFYKKYIELMRVAGKENKIPTKVFDRSK